MATQMQAEKEEKRGLSRKTAILKMLKALESVEDGQVIAKIQSGVPIFVTMVDEQNLLGHAGNGGTPQGLAMDAKQLAKYIYQALQKVLFGEVVVYVQQKVPTKVKAVNQVRV